MRRFAKAFPANAGRIIGLWLLEADVNSPASQAVVAQEAAAGADLLAKSAATPQAKVRCSQRTSLAASAAAAMAIAGTWVLIALATSHDQEPGREIKKGSKLLPAGG